MNRMKAAGKKVNRGKIARSRLSPVLEQGLHRYAIGARIRALRQRKKMRLVELARHTSLSPALLSKLESGQNFPTLPTLLRIAMVFSVSLDHFFAEDDRLASIALAPRSERITFPQRIGRSIAYNFQVLTFPARKPKLFAYRAEFLPAAALYETHQHDGCEFIYLLEGRLEVAIGATRQVLQAGDALYFDSSLPHGYARLNRGRCSAIVVTA